ncbi:hypothetical protein [Actinokineospora enzanensis]|uniref:hypothetical protein n=1 Tax=Actinokineospora enzanensis TaxID=155975 RepID=UPI00037A1978|nr:hypothetical protein [Actinokineospora enzanensis]
MPDFRRALWTEVREWFSKESDRYTFAFLPDPDGAPVVPNAGYLRIFFAEGFLADQRTWGRNQFPALHGGVSLSMLGGTPAFTTLARPPDKWTTPGAQVDFPMTALLPFTGGVVEIEAALYKATTDGPLGTAVGLIGKLATLLGQPLATAAQVADKLSDGLDAILGASGDTPVLGLHAALTSGDGPAVLRPGHFVLLSAPPASLRGTPEIADGRLRLRVGDGLEDPTGVDYLVIRVQCLTERDDWRFPELDELIRIAGDAAIHHRDEEFQARRTEAISRAYNNPDLTPPDRRRVALLVKSELDSLGDLGIIPGPARTLATIADRFLPAADDHRLAGLTLAGLLAS